MSGTNRPNQGGAPTVDIDPVDRPANEPIRVLGVGVEASNLTERFGESDIGAELTVLSVSTGEEALSVLRTDAVDAVVSRHRLPETSGLELLNAVRERVPRLPYVLVVDEGDESVASQAISAGVTDYVPAEDLAERPAVVVGRLVDAAERYRAHGQVRQAYLALETTQEGISLLDEDGQFTYVNEVYADNYGYDPEELLGMHWAELYPEDEADQVREEIRSQLDQEGQWTGETTGLRADGTTFPEQRTLTATDDGGLVCVVRDVTERKERERELQRYERIVENLPVGVYRTTPGQDGDIVEANPALASMFGADSVEAFKTHSPSDFYTEADGRAAFSRRMEREGAVTDMEFREETLDGETIRTSVTAMATEEDEVYFDGIVQDVTERKRRERELARYETLFTESRDVNAVLDDDGTLKYLTPSVEKELGYDPEELIGDNVLEYVHADDRDLVEAEYAKMVEDPDYEATVEFRLEAADGSWVELETRGRNLLDDPKIEGIVAYTRDVTGRNERERFLRELYEVTSDATRPFEEKLTRMLDLGREWFGADAGLLGRFEGEEYEIVESVGDDERIEPGRKIPRAETFCREVMERDDPVGITHASAEGWADDAAYELLDSECYLGTKVTDGHEPYGTLCFVASAPRAEPFTDVEETFLELMSQWVSYELERRDREAQLAALNDMSRDLMNAGSRQEIADDVVEHARANLDLPLAAVVGYDRESGRLSPVSQTARAEDELPTAVLCDRDSALWEAFVAGERHTVDDPASIPSAGPDLTEIYAVPLGQQGLVVAGTTATGGFSRTRCDLVETAAATVKAACTRAEREQQLHEREATLEQQNEALSRLNRVNDIIRSIDRALVSASTREEVQRVVCEQLADAGPYELAWIGDHDAVTDEVTPTEWAGADKGYLDEIEIRADDRPEGQGPAGRAVRSREPQVVDDILDDESFVPWRQAALNRGYHACVALPLVYEGSLYGILTVYAGQPGVFDDLERSVLAELSDTIAYAINAVESKKALVSDEVTELEFEVRDTGIAAVELVSETDCTFTWENVMPRTDGGFRGFFSTRNIAPEEIRSFASGRPVGEVTLIAERTEDDEPVCLFEIELSDESFCGMVLDHGGTPRTIRATDGVAMVVIDLAADAEIREFVEMFQNRYPDSELVAQRTRERERRTTAEFGMALSEELTPRQMEAIQTAYFSGYFERPRDRTASEVADAMDISQPTFTHHLRTAQRKLCRELFERDRTSR